MWMKIIWDFFAFQFDSLVCLLPFLFFNETFPSGCSKACREHFCEVVWEVLHSCGFIMCKSGISRFNANRRKRRRNHCLAKSPKQALSTKCQTSVIGNTMIRATCFNLDRREKGTLALYLWNYAKWTDNSTPLAGRQAKATIPPA